MNVERNGHAAHIFVSQSASDPIFHYTVQRVGSPEILYWGQESSMADAEFAVQEILDSKK